MSEAITNSIDVGDEALDAPAQYAVVTSTCRGMCVVSDEALDAPEYLAGAACYPMLCGIPSCKTDISDESLDAPEQHAVPCPAQNGPCGITYVSDEALDAAERPVILCTGPTPCVVCRVSDEARAAL